MRDILKSYHVESFQGYYYAKPLMPEQFLEWMIRPEGRKTPGGDPQHGAGDAG